MRRREAAPMHRLRGPHHLTKAQKRVKHMHKAAVTDHPVHELIRNRWSPRAFSDKPIPEVVLRSLFEAARWAPSSYNEQPWAYIVATKDDKVNFDKACSFIRWQASPQTGPGKPSEFPRDGIPSRPSPSDIPVIQRPYRRTFASRSWRLEHASPFVISL